jgi:hypothetical protein
MDRFTLLNAFATGAMITLPNGYRGIIASIEREDGSGYCYNVTLYGYESPVFVGCARPA